MQARWLCTGLLVGALCCPVPDAAEVPNPPPPLTLRAAVQACLSTNPDLAGFEFELRAQDARVKAAGLRPTPMLNIDVENVFGRGVHRGLKTSETTFSLSQVVELGAKRRARISTARSERELLAISKQGAQLDVVAEVARRFIQVAGHQEQLALTQKATLMARETVKAVTKRVNAAKAPYAELRRANISLSRAELEQDQAERELETSRLRLAALWGDSEARFGPVLTDLYTLPRPAPLENLLASLDRNPDFLRFVSEARLRDAELRLAEAKRYPDVTFSGGVRHAEETGNQALVFGFSLPLGTSRAAAPTVAEMISRRELTDARREATSVRVRAQLYEIYQALLSAISEAELLRDRVLPQLQSTLEETGYAYERGRYGYLEWVDAQREFLAAHRSLIKAAQNAHLFQTEIERLTGEPVIAQP